MSPGRQLGGPSQLRVADPDRRHGKDLTVR